jgi:hypothetical protein
VSSIRFNRPLTTSFETALYAQVDTFNLANYPELIDELFALYGLTEYLFIFNYFQKDEMPGLYHGKVHAYATALNCFEGALYSGCNGKQIKALLVAGLFHDIGHKASYRKDVYNIKRAKEILVTLHANMSPLTRLKDTELEIALNAISNTCFPHKAVVGIDVCSKVLRDADLMAAYLYEPIRTQLVHGLIAEGNIAPKGPLSMEQFCVHQMNWYATVVWHSGWGRNKAHLFNWPQVNKDMCVQLMTSTRQEICNQTTQ